MFEHLIADQSVEKWEGAWKGRRPEDLLSVEDGIKLQELILGGINRYHKFPTGVRSVSLLAQVYMGGKDNFIAPITMDGLDRKQPIMLHVEVEQGGNRDTSSDIEDNPSETKGAVRIHARTAAVWIAQAGVDKGLERIFTDINVAFAGV